MGGMGDNARNGRRTLGSGDALAGQHHRGSAIGNRRAGRGGDRSVLGEGGLERRDLVGLALAGGFVGIDDGVAAAALDRDGGDLVGEGPVGDGALRAAQRFDRVIVLCFAGQLILVRRVLRECAHGAACVIGVLEAVEEHMVIGGVMADACARAVLFEQIGGVGHALHAARDDDIDAARHQRFGAHDDGLHARPAHLVDRGCLHRGRQARLYRCLPGGSLAEACGEDAAHVDALDGPAVDA